MMDDDKVTRLEQRVKDLERVVLVVTGYSVLSSDQAREQLDHFFQEALERIRERAT